MRTHLFLHRSLPAFCFSGGAPISLAPLTSGILLSSGALISSCTAHFRPSAFQAVLISLLHRPLLTFCFQAVLLSLPAPLTSDFLFSGGAHFSPCTAHFRRSSFQAVLTSSLAPSSSDFLFSGGALISSCTAHFRHSAFQAVRTLLLAPLTSGILLSSGALISSCTAHF